MRREWPFVVFEVGFDAPLGRPLPGTLITLRSEHTPQPPRGRIGILFSGLASGFAYGRVQIAEFV